MQSADVPELNIVELLPDTVNLIVKLCSRVLAALRDASVPNIEEVKLQRARQELASIPRVSVGAIQQCC